MRAYRGPRGPIIQSSAVTRRTFVQGLVAGGVGAGLWRAPACAAAPRRGEFIDVNSEEAIICASSSHRASASNPATLPDGRWTSGW